MNQVHRFTRYARTQPSHMRSIPWADQETGHVAGDTAVGWACVAIFFAMLGAWLV